MSELAKRNAGKRKTHGGGRPLTCDCGKCRKCRMRDYQQSRRRKLLKTKEI